MIVQISDHKQSAIDLFHMFSFPFDWMNFYYSNVWKRLNDKSNDEDFVPERQMFSKKSIETNRILDRMEWK